MTALLRRGAYAVAALALGVIAINALAKGPDAAFSRGPQPGGADASSLSRFTAPIPETTALEDMTWVEVRAAIGSGYTTVLVPAGGVEQNGPHMNLGKHGSIVTAAAQRIAASLGHTLVAPTINYVPEGEYDPATGHMRFPGTLGVPESVFSGILEGAARSLKAGGFKTILFIGDHGANQAPQAAVAERLTREWSRDGVRVVHVQAYYDDAAQTSRLLKEGYTSTEIGEHASLIDTSELLSIHPQGVKLDRFQLPSPGTEESGARGDPRKATAELGASLLQMRVDAAIAQIKALRATN